MIKTYEEHANDETYEQQANGAIKFLNDFIVSIDGLCIKDYMIILQDYIKKHKQIIYEKGINLDKFISSYIEYMFFYFKYEKMIDFDAFMESYIEKYMNEKSNTLHRQKGINLL